MYTPLITIRQVASSLLISLAAACISPAWSGENRLQDISTGDIISIRSDDAWEDVAPDIIHFSGHFELNAQDWELSADKATMEGKLENPETVIMSGSPAQFHLVTLSKGQTVNVAGEASLIIYQRNTSSIRMIGNALVSRNDQSLKSEEIGYDIEQDRIRAGGTEGVHLQLEPVD